MIKNLTNIELSDEVMKYINDMVQNMDGEFKRVGFTDLVYSINKYRTVIVEKQKNGEYGISDVSYFSI